MPSAPYAWVADPRAAASPRDCLEANPYLALVDFGSIARLAVSLGRLPVLLVGRIEHLFQGTHEPSARAPVLRRTKAGALDEGGVVDTGFAVANFLNDDIVLLAVAEVMEATEPPIAALDDCLQADRRRVPVHLSVIAQFVARVRHTVGSFTDRKLMQAVIRPAIRMTSWCTAGIDDNGTSRRRPTVGPTLRSSMHARATSSARRRFIGFDVTLRWAGPSRWFLVIEMAAGRLSTAQPGLRSPLPRTRCTSRVGFPYGLRRECISLVAGGRPRT